MTDTLTPQSRAARKQLLHRRLVARGLIASETIDDAETTGTPAAPTASVDRELTVSERRMWRIHQLDPESISHNITLLVTIEGRSLAEIVASAQTLFDAAAVLRSTVTGDLHQPRRIVATGDSVTAAGTWQSSTSWSWLPSERSAALVSAGQGAEQSAELFARTPFDLTVELPLRIHAESAAGGQVRVALSFHHIALDDTSWPLLLGTLLGAHPRTLLGQSMASHAAPAGSSAPSAASAAGTAAARLSRAVEHARTTWAAPAVRYPLSNALPVTSAEDSWDDPLAEGEGRQLRIPIDRGVTDQFGHTAGTLGATSNALLIAVIALTVSAQTESSDFVMLVPADNRDPRDLPTVVGYSGNIVPIRFSIDQRASLRDTLTDAVAAIYGSMEFSDVDFGAILTEIRRTGGRFPVVEILGSVRDAPLRRVPVPEGIRAQSRSLSGGIASYPLSVAIEIAGDGLQMVDIDYQPAVLDDSDVVTIGSRLLTALRRVPTNLDLPTADLVAELRAVSDTTTR